MTQQKQTQRERFLDRATDVAAPIPPRKKESPSTGYEVFLRLTVYPQKGGGPAELRLQQWGSSKRGSADWPDGWFMGSTPHQVAQVVTSLIERLVAKGVPPSSH